MIICARVCGSSWAFHVCIFLVRRLWRLVFNCHMESPILIWAGCAAVRGDFICSFLVRRLKPAFFICHMESPMIIRARVCGSSWGFHVFFIHVLFSPSTLTFALTLTLTLTLALTLASTYSSSSRSHPFQPFFLNGSYQFKPDAFYQHLHGFVVHA
jgi:hypothetical protein